MTDRELLELAAKAGGLVKDGIYYGSNEWNPLTDDGDALRLAVVLNMHIHVDYDRTPQMSKAYVDGADEAEYAGDPYAATRRAIVRAAAEIGKIK